MDNKIGIEKTISKLIKYTSKIIKACLKKIPFLGISLAMKNAHEYFANGKSIQGYLELFSGYVAILPLYGTLISIGLDILNFGVDLYL